MVFSSRNTIYRRHESRRSININNQTAASQMLDTSNHDGASTLASSSASMATTSLMDTLASLGRSSSITRRHQERRGSTDSFQMAAVNVYGENGVSLGGLQETSSIFARHARRASRN